LKDHKKSALRDPQGAFFVSLALLLGAGRNDGV